MKKSDSRYRDERTWLERAIKSANGNHLLMQDLVTVDRNYWLESMLGNNENALNRQYRSLRSEIFLQTILYKCVERQEIIDTEKLVDLLIRFKRTISGPGRDFEIANVQGRIMNHFQNHSAVINAGSQNSSSMLDIDLHLFTILSTLDLKAIDNRVAELVREG